MVDLPHYPIHIVTVCTMILQRIMILLADEGFEQGIAAILLQNSRIYIYLAAHCSRRDSSPADPSTAEIQQLIEQLKYSSLTIGHYA